MIKCNDILANLRRSKAYQLSEHNDINLEINKKISGKSTKMGKLQSTLPKKSMSQKEIKRKNFLKPQNKR